LNTDDHPLSYPNRPARAKAYLEANDVDRLQKAATNLRDRLLIRLLSHLGCRISEALGIKVEDIDLDNYTITIQHLKARTKLSCPHCSARLGKSHSFCPKCGARVEKAIAEEKEHRRFRTLPIDDDTLRLLKDYILRGGPVSREGNHLIFGINRHRAWQIIKDCGERAGLPKLINPESGRIHGVSPHRLRDSFAIRAVRMDDSGDGLRLLQEHLGHHSITTTMRYRKVAGEELKTWYRKLWEEEECD
jgi:integrase/recombinase XerD